MIANSPTKGDVTGTVLSLNEGRAVRALPIIRSMGLHATANTLLSPVKKALAPVRESASRQRMS